MEIRRTVLRANASTEATNVERREDLIWLRNPEQGAKNYTLTEWRVSLNFYDVKMENFPRKEEIDAN